MTELRPLPHATGLDAVCRELHLPTPAAAVDVSGLSLDTRLVREGDLFAALPGANTHGARFAAAAVEAGAAAVLTDQVGAALLEGLRVPVLVIDDPRAALGILSRLVYAGPRPRLVGVTGTNGKTTTTHCLAATAEAAGVATAVVGTLGIRFRDLADYSGRTTPEAPSLHAALARLAEEGAALTAMEVSSHALALHRVDGLEFEVAVFLGLTQDHLDFHPTMEDYFWTKARLFDPARARAGIVNVDDAWGRRLASQVAIPSITYGLSAEAQWHPRGIVIDADGRTRFDAVGPAGEVPVTLSMPGGFNIANALAALATAHALGLDLVVAAGGLSSVSVPGRFERVENDRGVGAYVDYAHTPDAVERVLAVARGTTRGRLIVVLGCGGDRDAAKRPLMGAAAAAAADLVIITDDNPRSEDPAAIRRAIREGVHPGPAAIREIGDRATAIAAAVAAARPGDCIMVLGKGHETGQETAGMLHPFDDRIELRTALGATS